MHEHNLRVTRWSGPAPDAAAILHQYAVEGLRPYQWANDPGDQYAAHVHPYDKVLYQFSLSLPHCHLERSEGFSASGRGDASLRSALPCGVANHNWYYTLCGDLLPSGYLSAERLWRFTRATGLTCRLGRCTTPWSGQTALSAWRRTGPVDLKQVE
jgi:hypothetical protein